MHSLKAVCATGLVIVAVASGCGQQRQASETTQDTTAVAPLTPPASVPVTPGMAQLQQGEAQLDQIVEQGRLNEVHDQAGKIQATLKQVADQATPEQRQQLTEHLAAANRLADELHDAADAGDLTKTKAKLQEFKTHLRAIEGVFGVTTP